MEWKYTDSLVNKSFPAQQSVKKVMLTEFLEMKDHIDFFKVYL